MSVPEVVVKLRLDARPFVATLDALIIALTDARAVLEAELLLARDADRDETESA